MKTLLIISSCLILLAGCAGPLQDFTVNDLRAAGARAAAGNDPVAAQCYPAIADQIAGGKAPGPVSGVVDLFEAGRLAAMQAQAGIPAEVKAKCAQLSLELLVFLAKLGLKIAAPIPMIGP